MADNEQFLTITGVWASDNRLDLQPSYVTQSGEGASRGELEQRYRMLIVELTDDQGEIIACQPIAVTMLCYPPRGGSPELFVADKILFPEETRTLRFIRADTNTTVHEITRPESQPQIQFDWDPPEEMVVDGRQVISWTAGHPEELPLQFLVFYSHTDGQTWQPANLPLEDRELELDFDQLPGGERCRVKVLATDGANTTEVESGTFRVAEKGLRATILAPEDGATFPLGQAIWLRGQGFHLEEQRPELEDLTWTSSIDGELGSGSVVEVGPSQGRHDITLRAGEHSARISLKVVATLDMPT